MNATKKATIAVVASNKNHRPNYNTKNLFGLSRKQWSKILDRLESVIVNTLVVITFGVMPCVALFLAMFGRCL